MDLGQAPAQGTIALILVTAIISLLVGVFGKKLAEAALDLLLRPFRWLCERIYRYLAPRNPFSISVRSYRKHVLRSNLTRMENPVGPNLEVPLEHAFAPLKLRSSTTQESIDLFSYAASTRRCIVLGGPGTGKTTLMKSLLTSILKKRCHQDLDDLIPVFVVLRNLAKRQHTVQQAIVSALADHHFPGAEVFVQSSLDAGKMVVILDGLDEVGASREFVVEQILSFCQYDDQREHQNRLLVTCREHSYRTMDLREGIPEIVQVEPFANHHMRVFLEGWPTHKGRSAIRLYALIQGDPQIRDICRNPLLLTILTGLYLDADDFQIPSSRERFYQNAIEELLNRRPARRQIKQTFNADAKRQILERVALERLETVDQLEDPEELTREVILKIAEEVLRQDKVNIHELITELIDINGIVKPVSEASFTCAHRTILEYFAAREAMRRRKTSEVIATFGGRPELIEVLYFYCGLLENLPALASIVGAFAGQRRWLEAGRSLVHMKQVPDRSTVGQIASELRNLIVAKVDTKSALEVLSSMANRRDPEFETAEPFFNEAIDHLAASDETGASALESAIATSPEIALKLIPGMLKHSTERWKATGVKLLRDIGTDEALDQLVQLLEDKDPVVRRFTGAVLAGMIRTRNRALRQRAALLPERKDKSVWPLESYFPGTIALPIAEALAPEALSESRAIDCAIHALTLRQAGSEDPVLEQWQRVPMDANLQRYRRRVGVVIAVTGFLVPAALAIFLLALQVRASLVNRIIVVHWAYPPFAEIDKRHFDQLHKEAQAVVKAIETSYPPNASGWARILPWNWNVEPRTPEAGYQAFQIVESWASWRIKPDELAANKDIARRLEGLASTDKIQGLKSAVASLDAKLASLGRAHAVIRPMAWWLALLPPVMSIIMIYLFITLMFTKILRERWRLSKYLSELGSGENIDPKRMIMSTYIASSLTVVLLILPFQNYFWTAIMVAAIVGGFQPAALIVARLRWPNNPLLSTVNEVIAQESPLGRAGDRDLGPARAIEEGALP